MTLAAFETARRITGIRRFKAPAMLRLPPDELGKYRTPKIIRFVDDLPKGSSGKVQRPKLLDT